MCNLISLSLAKNDYLFFIDYFGYFMILLKKSLKRTKNTRVFTIESLQVGLYDSRDLARLDVLVRRGDQHVIRTGYRRTAASNGLLRKVELLTFTFYFGALPFAKSSRLYFYHWLYLNLYLYLYLYLYFNRI
ncbi:hypothetical protein DFJ43DRAFT_522473 [Lentinula guzmanii]|uniref:Uncharacterized protein n=1 Tax=Lentinula guzmanii TaxID=2804957 RepID=A0AA38JW58_9AGAR|nr:hypothetical protein DFJ43DRAFT_522473 [Lentinula guzmanii]